MNGVKAAAAAAHFCGMDENSIIGHYDQAVSGYSCPLNRTDQSPLYPMLKMPAGTGRLKERRRGDEETERKATRGRGWKVAGFQHHAKWAHGDDNDNAGRTGIMEMEKLEIKRSGRQPPLKNVVGLSGLKKKADAFKVISQPLVGWHLMIP
ncbi:hypothetical protein GPALN_013088 [Globodera pallida]|nr:hypothetical protein GPALN_013088 [Globodera pallida]